MREYLVRWEVDIEAETPQEAAEAALKMQRNPSSIATVFDVYKKPLGEATRVDLEEVQHECANCGRAIPHGEGMIDQEQAGWLQQAPGAWTRWCDAACRGNYETDQEG